MNEKERKEIFGFSNLVHFDFLKIGPTKLDSIILLTLSPKMTWVAVCVESNKSYVLSESSTDGIILGRSVADCDITLENDKSISRKHAQLIITKSSSYGSKLTLIDFGSKFGTTLIKRDSISNSSSRSSIKIPHKVDSNKPFEIQVGDVIQIGSFNSCIQFTNESFKFCVTRLDKAAKESVNSKLITLNASIVQSVAECTHLVCNQFSATLKMITAMALQKYIITSKWFDFLNTNKAAYLIPDVFQYSPFDPRGRETVGKEEYPVEPLTSDTRQHLLGKCWIFIPDPTSIEYQDVMQGCGAEVFDTASLDLTNSQQLKAHFSNLKQKTTEIPSQVLVFFEEEKISSLPHKVVSNISEAASIYNLPVLFLSSRNLVQSVITCTQPKFLDAPIGGSSVASRSQISSTITNRRVIESQVPESQMLDSQALDRLMDSEIEFAKPSQIQIPRPAPISISIPAPVPVQVSVPSLEPVLASELVIRSTRASKTINSPHTSAASAATSVELIISPSRRKRKADAEPEVVPISEVLSSPSSRRRKKSDTPVKDSVALLGPISAQTINSTDVKCNTEANVHISSSDADIVTNTASNTFGTQNIIAEPKPTVSFTAPASAADDGWTVVTRKDALTESKRSPVPRNTANKDIRNNISDSSSREVSQFSPDRSVNYDETVNKLQAPVDGWFSCLSEAQKRRTYEAKKAQFMRTNEISKTNTSSRLQIDDDDEVWNNSQQPMTDDGEFVQPVTIESAALTCTSTDRNRQVEISEPSSTSTGLKDVRRFHKNLVRSGSSDRTVYLKDMVKVFPKESEREIQMRLEADTERKRRAMHDNLFDEENQRGVNKPGQRRIATK